MLLLSCLAHHEGDVSEHFNKLENVVEIERKHLSNADVQKLNVGMVTTKKSVTDPRIVERKVDN